ncbi:hypothetical protein KA017_00995 [Candidatus Woesebacteria bacterium]|nr:hypothetical protein [Candidatus Woesebacteria bacterium]
MFETLVTSLIQKMSSNALILAFTGVTLATSGVAGAKLYNNLQAQQTPENVELSTEAEVLGVSTIDTIPDTTTQNRTTSETVSNQNTTNNTVTDTFPIASPTPTTVTQNNGNTTTIDGCIVKIFGKSYNVTSLKSSHPGGDVFVCGTDMSTAYQNAHGTNISRMASYEVDATNGNTNARGGNSNTTSGNITSFEHEEEHEDEEYHEEAERHYEDEDGDNNEEFDD